MKRFSLQHRNLIVGLLAPLLVLCSLSVALHDVEHLFHKHTVICDSFIAAHKDSSAPPATVFGVAVTPPVAVVDVSVDRPLVVATLYPHFFARAPPYTL